MGQEVDNANVLESSLFTIRSEVRASDAAAIRSLVGATKFFTDEEVDIAEELVLERLKHGEKSGYEFFFLECGDVLLGYTCYGRIAGTDSSYDLYWIAVSPAVQKKGIGRRLLLHTEAEIARIGGLRVYIETSGQPLYVPTQNFYLRCGYELEATLKDFYRRGDDKLIFVREVRQ